MTDQQIVLSVLFTTLLLLLLVAGIFISIYIAGRQRIQQELGYEKELRKVEAEVSEAMMEQFAQELHDNVGHTLTCMRIIIENKKMDNDANIEIFGPIEGYLDAASEQLKMLSRSLNTDYISRIGLHAAIQLEVDRLHQLKRQHIQWEDKAEHLNLNENAKLMAFRIFQEMIQNSIKHSKAKNIAISLTANGKFQLIVRDDGRGFDYETIMLSPKASGLKNMVRRAAMVGMVLHIKTKPGEGCIYTLCEK